MLKLDIKVINRINTLYVTWQYPPFQGRLLTAQTPEDGLCRSPQLRSDPPQNWMGSKTFPLGHNPPNPLGTVFLVLSWQPKAFWLCTLGRHPQSWGWWGLGGRNQGALGEWFDLADMECTFRDLGSLNLTGFTTLDTGNGPINLGAQFTWHDVERENHTKEVECLEWEGRGEYKKKKKKQEVNDKTTQ